MVLVAVMGREEDRQRAKSDRIERLRKRLEAVKRSQGDGVNPLVSVIAGILDLLEDEL